MPAAAVLLLGACGTEPGGGAASALVFADAEARQCETKGIPLEQSRQTLVGEGIDVLESSCGVRTGVAFAAVCGAPTGEILVHEIRAANLPQANELGYARIETLVEPEAGTGYTLVECSGRDLTD